MSSVVFTENAPAPVGPYSQAVKANGFVYLSGQVPLTPEGKLVEGHEDIQVQTRQALTNIKNVIAAAGTTWESIVKVNVFVTDIGDFGKINEVYKEFFNTHAPARSLVQVAALPLGVNIEIEAVATYQQ
ncbi:hypothetical protein D0Z00_000734 [Geotrichum galactomycetum]|uniref:Uncharacterized protein n=1 Tax=Geotrichum galactomycetum TaxID=27317 RepID=A0ACB6V8U4_9ASCO|nr:hypothetical protein D0Z00_000734 [Geotrichum candidum]